MWIMYFIPILIFIALIGLLWCLLGFAWVNKIHKRYKEQIDKPWDTLILKYKAGKVSVDELNKQHHFFLKLSDTSLGEYNRISPFYFIKHWNDQYTEKWLEKKLNKEVSRGNNNDR